MIKIIAVGKIKESFYTEAIEEYKKRLSSWTKLEIVEVKEVNNQDINKNIYEEGLNILKVLNDNDYVISLEIKGKKIDSIELSKLIEKTYTYNASTICFVIGGSNGLSSDVTARANYHLSFSEMTFPHQLMRVILMEQIYRSFTIINHKEYHK